MTTCRTYVQQLYNPAMIATQALTGLPAGQIGLNSTISASATTFQLAITVPSWVSAGMNVYDVTKAANIGIVSGSTSTTLTLSVSASALGSTGDVLQFGFTPSDLAVGAADGADIQGLVKSVILHMEEALAILTYLDTDVITNAQNSTAHTSLTNAVAQI